MVVDLQTLFNIEKYSAVVERTDPIKYEGRVTKVTGLTVESLGPSGVIGEVCRIILSSGKVLLAEIVGLEHEKVMLVCYDEMEGIEIGNQVIATGEQLSVYVGDHLLGRVLDGIGKDYDGKGGVGAKEIYPAFRLPSDAMKRQQIYKPISTGVKVIDGLLTVGKGQRIGIFAGSGVGKSTLLGMIARNTVADVNVIALIGERSRELKDFIEYDLGEEGMKKSVIIFASSNKNALCRVRGAYVATAIAEYFRDQGKDVMLMMDSLTRFAWAQREIGLSSGEPPTTKGFTPSVFTLLPKLLERAGTGETGSITGFYTVLVEGDDTDEPISDTVRGILDGHIVLTRSLAHKNHYPAIDVLASISRLMTKITSKDQQEKAGLIREFIAEYKKNEDLINIGAYASGSNPKVDMAIMLKDKIDDFLKQKIEEKYEYEETLYLMDEILNYIYINKDNEEDNTNLLYEESF
ncbi:MAG: flagellar protein export ATPase FliI [Spirochaetes bacterium GWD1_27_9]|nr:MAG: flagellar protein export ATPase FliI [Spirochaetes bacterium GWB1_27_13]OHD25339.1 MAG: flagellar protein export ATPase FliI [Spirochaetes bacterium GWC1_27_15]OHD31131.1 MAG: flagellar protein export ATPase FliI [Spirochaetes bacterium GWD1_27_9]